MFDTVDQIHNDERNTLDVDLEATVPDMYKW